MRRILALGAALLLAAGSAVERDLIVPERIGERGLGLAAVEQAVELVRRTRRISVGGYGAPTPLDSDLRVSLLVLDTGPASDVSPRQAVHLAMFNEIEAYGTSWALEPVAEVWEFFGVERRAAGIYVIRASIPAYTTGTEGCFFQEVEITVDARRLSVAVRNAPGLPEFGIQRYSEPIAVAVRKVRCLS